LFGWSNSFVYIIAEQILKHVFYFINTYFRSLSTKVLSFVLMAFAWIIIRFCESTYKEKSWYSTDFYPPLHYIKGLNTINIIIFSPLSNDQGNSL